MKCIGPLDERIQEINSSVVGVGHMRISIVDHNGVYSTGPGEYFLKFTLKRFQLLNKSDRKRVDETAFVKSEPPEDIEKAVTTRSKGFPTIIIT